MPWRLGRRAAIASLATGLCGSLGGCLTEPSFPDADVVAGPAGRLVFDPAAVTVAVGQTVTWGFASSGHNVSARPDHAEMVVLPVGAEPFASYGASASPLGSHVSRGETFEHRFDVAGRYRYACVPHLDSGMVGTVTVEDGT